MTQTAYIYDAIRTPGNKGKAGGNAIKVAAQRTVSGWGNLTVAGGVESMVLNQIFFGNRRVN